VEAITMAGRTSVTAILFTLLTAAPSTGQDISWITQFGTPGVDETLASAADASGVYVAGNTTLALEGQSSTGGVDAFLRKYDRAGALQWTVQFGTPLNDFGQDVAVDATGVYVVGQTTGAFPGQVDLGRADIYVRKFTLGGQMLWTTQFGTDETDGNLNGHSVIVHAGQLYVTGFTRGAFPGETANGDRDVFLAKLDASTGSVDWAHQFGTAGNDVTDTLFGGLAADDTGIYVVANLNVVGSLEVAVLRKYDAAGNVLWASEVLPECRFFSLTGVAAQASAVYVLGQALADPSSDGLECASKPGNDNVVGVLMKHDTDGNTVWTRTIEGRSQQGSDHFTGAKGVAAFESGVYVAGNLTTSFAGQLHETARGANGACVRQEDNFFSKLDTYIRRFDDDGRVVWTHQFGSPNYEVALQVSTDGSGVYTSGHTACVIAAGQTFSGELDAYVARFEIEPTSPAGQIQLIVGKLETVRASAHIDPGHFNALVGHLETALAGVVKEQSQVVRQALTAFMNLVDSLDGNTLSALDASALRAAATGIIQGL
jgi:outer membrane protein assembly factor BamB